MKNESAPSFIPPTMLVQNFARPAGVSLLDAMVHQYEKDTGRKSQLPAATIAKLEGASPKSDVSKRFANFLETGKHGIYTQAETKAMLDHARSLLLTRPAPLPAAPRTATATTPRPVATATPAPSPTSETVSAREFEGPPLKMTKPEFDKLTPAGKSKFSTSGGRIV